MESTWATIKREIRHIHVPWPETTRSQLRGIPFSSIETFRNPKRHQTRPGHRILADVYADHAARKERQKPASHETEPSRRDS